MPKRPRMAMLSGMVLLALSVHASAGDFVRLERGTDVTQKFKKGTQLYIKEPGVGLDDAAASQIADQLAKHPNWVVVLVGSVVGEEFVTPEGQVLSGRTAVEYAVGTELMKSGAFSSIVSENGERSGSALLYTFDEEQMLRASRGAQYAAENKRALFCYTSPLLEKRGISDEGKWLQSYAPLARNAFQNGRDITAMIIDPITSVESDFAAKAGGERPRATPTGGSQMPPLHGPQVGPDFPWRWFFILLAGAAFGCFLIYLITRANARKKAQDLIGNWERAIAEKGAALVRFDGRKAALLGRRKSEVTFSGSTAELAHQVIDGVSELFILMSSARSIFDQAKAAFDSGQSRKCIELLSGKVTFRPDDKLRIVIEGKEVDPDEVLWADVKKFKPFELTFDELMSRFSTLARALDRHMDAIESAKTGMQRAIANAEASLAEAAKLHAQVASLCSSRSFAYASFTELARVLGEQIAGTTEIADSDPLGAKAILEAVMTRLGYTNAVMQRVEKALASDLQALERTESVFTDSKATWPTDRLAAAVQAANAYLGTLSALQAEVSKPESVIGAFNQLLLECERALKIFGHAKDRAQPKLQEAVHSVQNLRDSASSQLNLPEEQILVEDGSHVDTFIQRAQSSLGQAQIALGKGDLETASKKVEDAERDAEQVIAICTDTEATLSGFASRMQGLRSAARGSDSTISESKRVLSSLRSNFHPEVFNPEESGIGEKGTRLDSHGELIERLAAERLADLDRADRLFSEAKVLGAKKLLDQVDEANKQIRKLCEDIANLKRKLDEVGDSNQSSLSALEGRLRTIGAQALDNRVRSETHTLLRSAEQALGTYSSRVRRREGENPFAIGRLALKVDDSLDHVERSIRKDCEDFDEAQRSINAAREQLQSAESAAERLRRDGKPDSAESIQAMSDLDSVRDQVNRLSQELFSAARPWTEIDRHADKACDGARKVTALLLREEKEVQRAQEALSALVGKALMGAALQASRDARAAFQRGNYEEAVRLAERAHSEQRRAEREASSTRSAGFSVPSSPPNPAARKSDNRPGYGSGGTGAEF